MPEKAQVFQSFLGIRDQKINKIGSALQFTLTRGKQGIWTDVTAV